MIQCSWKVGWIDMDMNFETVKKNWKVCSWLSWNRPLNLIWDSLKRRPDMNSLAISDGFRGAFSVFLSQSYSTLTYLATRHTGFFKWWFLFMWELTKVSLNKLARTPSLKDVPIEHVQRLSLAALTLSPSLSSTLPPLFSIRLDRLSYLHLE